MIFFSQAPEMKALKCIKLDGLFSLCSTWTMNWGVADSFWVYGSSVQSPACMLFPKLQNELVTDTGSIPSAPFKHFWSKNNRKKKQILTENYFDRSKSRNGYISDSIYFLCLLSRDHEFWTWSIELTYKIIKIILIFLFGTLATFQR